MEPPPSHRLYPAQNHLYLPSLPSATTASQPHDATFYTPMSPYKPPNPTSYSLPHPPFPSSSSNTGIPYAANSAAFYPPSSSNVGLPHHHTYYPAPRTLAINNNNPPIPQPTLHHSSPNVDSVNKLRNEVIFLHQLWHQGPPNSNSNFRDPVGNLHPHLKPCHSTAFKKKKKKNSPPLPVSDNPWPVPPDPTPLPESESGWPEFPPRPTPLAPISSGEDSDRVSAARVQHKAINSFQSFFAKKHGPESESESDDDDFPDQDEASDDDVRAKFDKFLGLFEADVELKEYYEKNWANGEFLCLVCGGTGQKMAGRKYKNCLALVQHTVTISNTKKRAAHRAYGLVLCKVLGWDINQLSLVSRNLSLQQGNEMSSAEACKDDPVGVETDIEPLVNDNKQSETLKATSEKKETSELPLVFDNPGDKQINDTSNAGNSSNHSDTAEENTNAMLNERGLSDPPKAGTDTDGNDHAAEKKESSSLPCTVADSEGDNADQCLSVNEPATQI